MQAFSSCGEQGLLFVAVCGLLIAEASLCFRARALRARASVVVARRLWSTGSVVVAHGLSCSAACGAQTCIPGIGRQILNHCATREALNYFLMSE